MKILVTGASGFIGYHCCAQLSAKGYEVHAVSSKSQSDDTINWHKADLLDSEQSLKLIHNIQPTHLLHLAWYAEPGQYWTSKQNYLWVRASLALFEKFAEYGGQRIVAAGSCAEYEWGYERYIEGITPIEPASPYGVCKHSLQMMLCSYAKLSGISWSWGRIFSVYGPREHPNRLFSSVIIALLSGKTVQCANGLLIRDYLHASDVASAFNKLLLCKVDGVFNIGSGNGITLGNLMKNIELQIGNEGLLKIATEPPSKADTPVVVADIKRILDIGWQPEFDLENGLRDTIDWFRKNHE